MTKINELKDKIQKLLNYSNNLSERSKNLSRLLYQQLYEIIELERLEKLEGKFLAAYLLWKSIMRANYQTELLKIAPKDKEKLLETIETEINSIEKRNQAEISQELTNEELLTQLGLRIKKGEIKPEYIGDSDANLYISESISNKTMMLSLEDGEIEAIEKSHAN